MTSQKDTQPPGPAHMTKGNVLADILTPEEELADRVSMLQLENQRLKNVMALEVCSLNTELDRLQDEIKALTHEGRQGELEQANVGLAAENARLREALESVETLAREAIKGAKA